MEDTKIVVGATVQMKKTHPCGSDMWELMRVGMDIKMKCLGCGRVVMIPRVKFNKQIKSLKS